MLGVISGHQKLCWCQIWRKFQSIYVGIDLVTFDNRLGFGTARVSRWPSIFILYSARLSMLQPVWTRSGQRGGAGRSGSLLAWLLYELAHPSVLRWMLPAFSRWTLFNVTYRQNTVLLRTISGDAEEWVSNYFKDLQSIDTSCIEKKRRKVKYSGQGN